MLRSAPMSKPAFSIPAADLERGPKSLTAPLPNAWLRLILADTDAEPQGDGSLDVELMKTGRSVMVRGKASARVTIPCVVTLEPLPFELNPEVFLLLSPSETAQRPHGSRKSPEKPGSPERKRSKKRVNDGDGEDIELSEDDAAKDTFDGENVVLDGFIREFLVLELPLYPRRADLPSEPTPANPPPPSAPVAEAPVDPRLQPLAAIAKRLGEQKKE